MLSCTRRITCSLLFNGAVAPVTAPATFSVAVVYLSAAAAACSKAPATLFTTAFSTVPYFSIDLPACSTVPLIRWSVFPICSAGAFVSANPLEMLLTDNTDDFPISLYFSVDLARFSMLSCTRRITCSLLFNAGSLPAIAPVTFSVETAHLFAANAACSKGSFSFAMAARTASDLAFRRSYVSAAVKRLFSILALSRLLSPCLKEMDRDFSTNPS